MLPAGSAKRHGMPPFEGSHNPSAVNRDEAALGATPGTTRSAMGSVPVADPEIH